MVFVWVGRVSSGGNLSRVSAKERSGFRRVLWIAWVWVPHSKMCLVCITTDMDWEPESPRLPHVTKKQTKHIVTVSSICFRPCIIPLLVFFEGIYHFWILVPENLGKWNLCVEWFSS